MGMFSGRTISGQGCRFSRKCALVGVHSGRVVALGGKSPCLVTPVLITRLEVWIPGELGVS